MGLQQFERRLERVIEGTFTRAFRSGIQPVELGVRGTVAPNEISVTLAEEDLEHFADYSQRLAAELADLARDHARAEGYHFLGPVRVELTSDPRAKRGSCRIDARIVAGEGSWASLARSDGTRIPLGEQVSVIGRLPDCEVTISDPQASRQHAEIRPVGSGHVLVDLGSTNGTLLNGTLVHEQQLRDGDQITIGSTTLRFEEG